MPSSATVITTLFDWSTTMALSGMSVASYSMEPGIRMRPNWPGVMKSVGIGKDRAHAYRAGAGVDRVVDEVHHALVRPVGLVREARLDVVW